MTIGGAHGPRREKGVARCMRQRCVARGRRMLAERAATDGDRMANGDRMTCVDHMALAALVATGKAYNPTTMLQRRGLLRFNGGRWPHLLRRPDGLWPT